MALFNYFILILLIFPLGCNSKLYVINSETEQIPISNELYGGPNELTEIIEPYKTVLDKTMNDVLAYSSQVMEKNRPEGLLGNIFSDLCMEIAIQRYKPIDGKPIDFAIFNHGGLRSVLPTGAITRKDIFEIMPFENKLVVVHLKGSDLPIIWEYLQATGGQPVSGIRIIYSGNNISSVTIQEKPVDPQRNYKILTSDYLANGGDEMDFFLIPYRQNIEALDLKVRDAMIMYMEQSMARKDTLKSKLDGRIQFL